MQNVGFLMTRLIYEIAIFFQLQILLNNLDIFLIFAQNINCGYTLEPHNGPQSIYVLEPKSELLKTPVLILYKNGVYGCINYTDDVVCGYHVLILTVSFSSGEEERDDFFCYQLILVFFRGCSYGILL